MSGKIKTLQFTEGVETVKPTTLTNFSSDLVVESISAGQQAEVGKLYLVDTTGGTVALTLPASPIDNDRLAIKLTNGNNNVTFAGQTIKRPGEVMQFQYGNSSWLIVSAYNSDLAKTSTVGQVLTADDLEGGASFQDLPNDLPAAGATAQALRKVDGTDYNVAWADVEEVPAGGTTGQALRKNSATDYDASFADVNEVPAGGAINQVLTKASGTDYDLTWADASGGGSGSGEINYIDNPDAELSTAGYVAYADAAQSTPEDGTAGSPTVAINRTTVVGEVLRGSASFELAKDAADRQGEGVSFDFSIDPADENKLLKVYFDYKTSTNYATGDVAVYIYDVTNATLITPNNTSIVKADAEGAFFECSWLSTDSNSYRLILHCASTNASAYDLFFDNVIVGPSRTQSGAVVSSWQDITLNWSASVGTRSSETWKMRRVGETMEIQGFATFSGTGSASLLYFDIPDSLTCSLTSGADKHGIIGNGSMYDDSVGTGTGRYLAAPFIYTSTQIGIYTEGLNSLLGSEVAANDHISLNINIPIDEWAGSGVMNVLQEDNLKGWTNFTPTDPTNLTSSSADGYYRRVGDSLEVRVNFISSGAVGGSIILQSSDYLSVLGLTLDTSAFPSNTTGVPVGKWFARDTGSTTNYVGVAYIQTNGDIISGNDAGTFVTSTIPFTWASTDKFSLEFTVPVAEWANVNQNSLVGFSLATADNAGLLPAYYDSGVLDLPTLTWSGSTPTTLLGAKYRWIKIGKQVTVAWDIEYSAANGSQTSVYFAVNDTTLPEPAEIYNSSGSEYSGYNGSGTLSTGTTSSGNSGVTAFFGASGSQNIYIVTASIAARVARGTLTYFTDD